MWHDQIPGTDVVGDIWYSTNFYTERAVDLIRSRNRSKPFYLYQAYQAVHEPLEEPPAWEQIPNGSAFWDHTWGSMLSVVDTGIANITAQLRAEGMYDNTLLVLTADNGGDCHGPSNNFPLRGRKCTPWDGG
eukprot:gene13290-1327_t